MPLTSPPDTPDPFAILSALGVSDSIQAETFAGGQDALIWQVERANGNVSALRLFRAEQTGPAERERVAIRAAAQSGLPVPVIEAFGMWSQRPAVLISWCVGVTMGELLATSPQDIAVLGRVFGQMQARIHRVSAPPKPSCPDAWIARMEGTEPELESHLRAVPRRFDALLHLDYHPFNVLMRAGQVSGVIDWVDSLPGDPRADIANTITTLRLAPLPPELTGTYDAQKRRLLELAYLRGYRAESGQRLKDMPLFFAWAGAAKLANLTPKMGIRPGLTNDYLDQLRQWTERWKARAGISC